jgi:elongation factor G
VPAGMAEEVAARRAELVEAVANADDDVMELYIEERPVDGDALAAAIRRATVSRAFFPVFLGSAYKNVGVQLLLDGVSSYLPDPTEVRARSVHA